MADQNSILAQLVWHAPKPVSLATLNPACIPLSRARKQMLSTLGKLMQQKLVARANKRTGFGHHFEPLYIATAAGIAFSKSGKRITSGAKGPRTGITVRANTFRQRLWNALRIQKKATIPQLIEIIREKCDSASVEGNALKYMTALVRAGVAAKLPTREKGFAPTSNGFLRFALLRDLGPLAPQAGAKHLINLNAATDAEKFVTYAIR